MNRSGTRLLGLILITFGIALLFNEYGFGLRINFTWPVFLFFTGGVLLAAYFTSRPRQGFLQGGMILVSLGIYFTLMEDVPALKLRYSQHWPGILIAIGIGLLVSGIIDRRSRKMIGAGIMTAGIGAAILLFSIGGWRHFGPRSVSLLFGIVLLLVGVKVVIDVFIKKKVEA